MQPYKLAERAKTEGAPVESLPGAVEAGSLTASPPVSWHRIRFKLGVSGALDQARRIK